MAAKPKKRKVSVRSSPVRKGKYNLADASDIAIMSHGFPPPPDPIALPGLYQLWRKMYARDFHVIAPQFTPRRRKRKRLGLSRKQIANGDAMFTWSGSLLNDGVSAYASIGATWTVPDVTPPGAPVGNKFFCSVWVGIGGLYKTNIVQAGIEHDCTAAAGPPDVYFWYEWWPGLQQPDRTLKVSVGDSVSFLVEILSGNQFRVHFSNNTQGYRIPPLTVRATGGEAINAQSAEWIVERPLDGGFNSQLANFSTVSFTDMLVATSAGTEIQGGTGNLVTMVDDSASNNLAVPAEVSPSSITVTYAGA
jgi:hypothetical protein